MCPRIGHTRPCARSCAKPCQTYRVCWLVQHDQSHTCVWDRVEHTDFNSNSTPGNTQLCNMAMCHTRLRNTLVSLPMCSILSILFYNNLGARDTRLDHTPMGLTVCHTRPRHMLMCLTVWTFLGLFSKPLETLYHPFTLIDFNGI